MEIIIFFYFILWGILGISILVVSRLVKDDRTKAKINNILGIVNAVVFIIVMNVLLHSWKTPVIIRLFFNFVVIIMMLLGLGLKTKSKGLFRKE